MNVETVRDRQDAAETQLIAGVSVLDRPLIRAAIDYAQRLSGDGEARDESRQLPA
jgi:hypothetical protein